MRVTETKFDGVKLLEPTRHADPRGFISENFKDVDFKEATGLDPAFVQDNHTMSRRGALRGMHYQEGEKSQGKLIAAVRGRIFHVFVDLRQGSESFGAWMSTLLSEEVGALLWVPGGLATGYLVLSERADVMCKMTARYEPKSEKCIRWDDPLIDIQWPDIGVAPTVSRRDQAGTVFLKISRGLDGAV